MTEIELLSRIGAIVNGRASFHQALQHISTLLEHKANGKGVFLEPSGAVTLLESFDQPYRSLYTADLRASGRSLGKLTLCFASDRFEGPLQQRLADFVGQQLGMLLERTRLRERREGLRAEINRLETDLAARKVLQRAEGILIANGMAPAAAKRWIATQNLAAVEGLIAYHRLAEQKIA